MVIKEDKRFQGFFQEDDKRAKNREAIKIEGQSKRSEGRKRPTPHRVKRASSRKSSLNSSNGPKLNSNSIKLSEVAFSG